MKKLFALGALVAIAVGGITFAADHSNINTNIFATISGVKIPAVVGYTTDGSGALVTLGAAASAADTTTIGNNLFATITGVGKVPAMIVYTTDGAGALTPITGGGGSGVTTMAAVGSSPNANGASISGTTLTLQPANGSSPGVLTAGTQTIGGTKTFSGNPTYWGTADATVVSGASPDFAFTTSTSNHTAVWFGGPTGTTQGGLAMITLLSGGWYIQAAASNDGTGGGAQPLYLNPQGSTVVLGSAVNTVTMTGYTSCTALTTNGSNVVGCTASDERLKKDIVPFGRGLEALKEIRPITFKFKDPGDLDIEHSGFSAQNVEGAIPEAVRIGTDGNRMLDYWTLIAVQANAINELRERVEALEALSTAKAPVKASIPMKAVWVAPPLKPLPCIGPRCQAEPASKKGILNRVKAILK